MPTADEQELACWAELSRRWSAWAGKGEELVFSAEATGYFERLSHSYFRTALSGHGELARYLGAMPAATDCWAIVLRDFTRQREGGVRVIEDLFLRALGRAQAHGQTPTLETAIGWIKKQFELRVRDVVRSWVREQWGAPSLRRKAESLEGARGEDGDGRDGHELIASDGLGTAEEVELRELNALGAGLAAEIFAAADEASRAVVYLKSIRVSLARSVVTAALGRGKSVLFELEKTMRQRLVDGAWKVIGDREDAEGARIVASAAYRELRDASREWFFSEIRDSGLFALAAEHDVMPEEIADARG